jgi:hypothetical protein
MITFYDGKESEKQKVVLLDRMQHHSRRVLIAQSGVFFTGQSSRPLSPSRKSTTLKTCLRHLRRH